MSEAIRLFNADETVKLKLDSAGSKASYTEMREALKKILAEETEK